MQKMSKRILSILDNRKWSIADLARKTGMPYETLKNIIYCRTDDVKTFQTLKPIATALNVTTDFLLDMKTYPKDEMEILKNYRRMSKHGKQCMLALSRFEAEYTEYENKKIDIRDIDCITPNTEEGEIKYYIPCIEPTGFYASGVSYYTSTKTVISTYLENAFIGIKIPNDFLSNTFFKGDVIILEQRKPEVGEIAVYHKNNYIYIRKYIKDEINNKHILKSLNIDVEDIIVTPKEFSKYSLLGTCIHIDRKSK